MILNSLTKLCAGAMIWATVFLSVPGIAHAKGYFALSATVIKAYEKTMCLRFQDAKSHLNELKKHEPENLLSVLVENYLDFLTVFTNGTESDYKRLRKNMDERLAKISRGDRNSPYFLYTQAEIRLQWAMLRSQFGDYLTAMSDIKQAYALLVINQQRFPEFIANKKSLGIIHTLAGNVPDDYKWTVRALGGIKGDMEQGMRELEQVLAFAQKNEFIFENETVVTYAFLQLYLHNQAEKAWQTLKNSKLDPKTNPLAAQIMSTIAMRCGHNDEAINWLKQAPAGADFHPLLQRWYLLGLAKLRRLDSDASVPLLYFLQHYTGKNGKKEAYQKLAWNCLIQSDLIGYKKNMETVKQAPKTSGEGDNAAQQEAESGETPDIKLLKARLLFDGGYYQRAYDLLKPLAAEYSANLEYSYRLGRIAHEMNKTEEATTLYNRTITEGNKNPRYFACSAALQLGLLYEKQKNSTKANQAFQQCLGISPKEYAASLHAKAKAGLERIK